MSVKPSVTFMADSTPFSLISAATVAGVTVAGRTVLRDWVSTNRPAIQADSYAAFQNLWDTTDAVHLSNFFVSGKQFAHWAVTEYLPWKARSSLHLHAGPGPIGHGISFEDYQSMEENRETYRALMAERAVAIGKAEQTGMAYEPPPFYLRKRGRKRRKTGESYVVGHDYEGDQGEPRITKIFEQTSGLKLIAKDWSDDAFLEDLVLGTLCTPVEGTDFYQERVGRRIYVDKLKYRINIFRSTDGIASPAAVPAPSSVRVVFVVDKQTNGERFDPDDLFGSSLGMNQHFAYQNPDNFGRFNVVFDEFVQVEQLAYFDDEENETVVYGSKQIVLNGYINLNNLEIHFNSNATGTIDSLINNSLHCLVRATGLGEWFAACVTRCTYIDL